LVQTKVFINPCGFAARIFFARVQMDLDILLGCFEFYTERKMRKAQARGAFISDTRRCGFHTAAHKM